jgi:hypothetical protein
MSTEHQPTQEVPPGLSASALSSMLESVAGLRNLRAAAAMLGCFLLALVVGSLVVKMSGGSILVTVTGGLISAVLMFTGVHASGVLLMDQARRIPMRSLQDAVLYGLMCVPKTIALIIALVLGAIAVYAMLGVLFWISKIPGIGPLLYAVVFPLSVVVAGLTFAGLFLGLLIAMAAIWEGASIIEALGKAATVLQKRLVETVMLVAALVFLASVVMAFVGSVLALGFLPAVGMSENVLGVSPTGAGAMAVLLGEAFGGGFGGGRGGGGGGGYFIAGMFGAGALWALVITLEMQVVLMGFNLIYLRVTEGLDASGAQGVLQTGLAEARRRAVEAGSRAREATERARAQAERALDERRIRAAAQAQIVPDAALTPRGPAARAVAPTGVGEEPVAPTVISPSTCPACRGAVGRDDIFCGACGHRLHA